MPKLVYRLQNSPGYGTAFYLSIYPIYLSIYPILSIYLFVYLSIYLYFVCVYIYIYIYICYVFYIFDICIDISIHLYIGRCIYKIAALSFKNHSWLHLHFLLEVMENTEDMIGTKVMYF